MLRFNMEQILLHTIHLQTSLNDHRLLYICWLLFAGQRQRLSKRFWNLCLTKQLGGYGISTQYNYSVQYTVSYQVTLHDMQRKRVAK